MRSNSDLNLILLKTLHSMAGQKLSSDQERHIESVAQKALIELVNPNEQSVDRVAQEFIKIQTALNAHIGEAKKDSLLKESEGSKSIEKPGEVGRFNAQQMMSFFKMRAPCLVEYPDGAEGALVAVLPSGSVYGIGGSEPSCRLEELKEEKTPNYPKQLSRMFQGDIQVLREDNAQQFLRFYKESAKYAVENQSWQMEQVKKLEKEMSTLFKVDHSKKKGMSL